MRSSDGGFSTPRSPERGNEMRYLGLIVSALIVFSAAPASAQSQNRFWYYCDASQTYYPYVKSCMTPWQRVRPKSLYVSPILPAQSPEQEPIQAPAPTPTPTPIPAVPDNLPVVDPPVIKTTSTGTDVTLDFVLPIESDNLPLTGPKAYCAKPDVVHNIIDALNSTDAVRSANQIVIDFLHSETTKIDVEGKTFSCHGTANISNGQMLTGTFSITNNGAGDSIWKWMNDPAAPASNQQAKSRQAQMRAMINRRMRQQITTAHRHPRMIHRQHKRLRSKAAA